MKNKFSLILLGYSLLLFLFSSLVFGLSINSFTISGVANENDTPITGTQKVLFRIYDNESGTGSILYSESQNINFDKNGIFTAILGGPNSTVIGNSIDQIAQVKQYYVDIMIDKGNYGLEHLYLPGNKLQPILGSPYGIKKYPSTSQKISSTSAAIIPLTLENTQGYALKIIGDTEITGDTNITGISTLKNYSNLPLQVMTSNYNAATFNNSSTSNPTILAKNSNGKAAEFNGDVIAKGTIAVDGSNSIGLSVTSTAESFGTILATNNNNKNKGAAAYLLSNGTTIDYPTLYVQNNKASTGGYAAKFIGNVYMANDLLVGGKLTDSQGNPIGSGADAVVKKPTDPQEIYNLPLLIYSLSQTDGSLLDANTNLNTYRTAWEILYTNYKPGRTGLVSVADTGIMSVGNNYGIFSYGGKGPAGRFIGAGSGKAAIEAEHTGNSNVAKFTTTLSTNYAPTILAEHKGTGRAGSFTSGATTGTLYSSNTGSGPALESLQTGTGKAAEFKISNANSPSNTNAVEVTNLGLGRGIYVTAKRTGLYAIGESYGIYSEGSTSIWANSNNGTAGKFTSAVGAGTNYCLYVEHQGEGNGAQIYNNSTAWDTVRMENKKTDNNATVLKVINRKTDGIGNAAYFEGNVEVNGQLNISNKIQRTKYLSALEVNPIASYTYGILGNKTGYLSDEPVFVNYPFDQLQKSGSLQIIPSANSVKFIAKGSLPFELPPGSIIKSIYVYCNPKTNINSYNRIKVSLGRQDGSNFTKLYETSLTSSGYLSEIPSTGTDYDESRHRFLYIELHVVAGQLDFYGARIIYDTPNVVY